MSDDITGNGQDRTGLYSMVRFEQPIPLKIKWKDYAPYWELLGVDFAAVMNRDSE